MVLSVLSLPPEILFEITTHLSDEDLFSLLRVKQFLHALDDSVTLIHNKAEINPCFFKFEFLSHQVHDLKYILSTVGYDKTGRRSKRPKLQRSSHQQKIVLIELPFDSRNPTHFDKYRKLLALGGRRQIIAVITDDLTSITNDTEIPDFNMLPLTVHQKHIDYELFKLLDRYKDFTMIIPNCKEAYCFDILPNSLSFPNVVSFCLHGLLHQAPTSQPKFYFKNLQKLTVGEAPKATSSIVQKSKSMMERFDLSKYPTNEFYYHDFRFIDSEDKFNSIVVKDLEFTKLRNKATLTSATKWQDINFPNLKKLVISTELKADQMRSSSLSNISAPKLEELEIICDCAQFPEISSFELPDTTHVLIETKCIMDWEHHCDPVYTSRFTAFLAHIKSITLKNSFDLIQLIPSTELQTMKLLFDEDYLHVHVLHCPKIFPNLTSLSITKSNQIMCPSIYVPSPNLKTLRLNDTGYTSSFDLEWAFDNYPQIERLYIDITGLNIRSKSNDQKILSNLKSLTITFKRSNKQIMDVFKSFKFPELISLKLNLKIPSPKSNDSFDLKFAPKLEYLDIHTLTHENSELKIFNAPSLKSIIMPWVSNLVIPDIESVKEMKLSPVNSTINGIAKDDFINKFTDKIKFLEERDLCAFNKRVFPE